MLRGDLSAAGFPVDQILDLPAPTGAQQVIITGQQSPPTVPVGRSILDGGYLPRTRPLAVLGSKSDLAKCLPTQMPSSPSIRKSDRS